MASAVSLVLSVVGGVCRVMEKDAERHEKLCCGLEFIKSEMETVYSLIKDKEYSGGVQETRIQQLQELAYDVEDFVETLWEAGAYGKVLVAIGSDPRAPQLIRIELFKERILYLTKDWKEQSAQSSSKVEDADEDDIDMSAPYEDAQEKLEGIDGPKREILELLSPSPGEGQQLRVISIVGCRGVGKTSLARAVYEDISASDAFHCVAWVMASGCKNRKDLLNKILQSVQDALSSRVSQNARAEDEGDASPITLRDIMLMRRCLIFIDDVQQAQVWKETLDACPRNGSQSRIIVTTSFRSVAAAGSTGSYVYSMQCLSNDDSKVLFWRKVYYGSQGRPSYSLQTASESIIMKCGGLPLALISVAKHLNLRWNDLCSLHCEDVGQNLGKHYLSGNNNAVTAFTRMRRTLMQCYDNLPDYNHRFLLLYLSTFPRGHQIKGKTLIRRLIAEGLVVNDGCKCFDELIDRCIVQPVQISNNSVDIKSCKVHDVLLEYIIQKSADKNVVTLIQGREPPLTGSSGASVRRLSIQCRTEEIFDAVEDKSASLRSLTMFQREPFELQNYTMLRLLDLEGCTGLGRTFLEGLCSLLLLRYLSLRKTDMNKLPSKIDKLQRLETLDIRETSVSKLSVKVIMLPKLANLFGTKFELVNDDNKEVPMKILCDFLKKKSLLHTLSGLCVTNNRVEHATLQFARNLKKVKVWGNPSSSSHKKRKFSFTSSSRETMEHNPPCSRAEGSRCANFNSVRLLLMPFNSLDAVSIVTGGLCNDFLESLEGPCTISSIKLKGNLNSLPDSTKLRSLWRIKKLQLFSTGLTFRDLSSLQYLRGLEFLKLVEYSDTSCNSTFLVEVKGFESLKSLCIDAPMVPKLQFNEGAMESLTSLHLLCPNSHNQLPIETVEGISHLANLSEVILHSSMQQDWETVANGHPNRPCVKRQMEQTA